MANEPGTETGAHPCDGWCQCRCGNHACGCGCVGGEPADCGPALDWTGPNSGHLVNWGSYVGSLLGTAEDVKTPPGS